MNVEVFERVTQRDVIDAIAEITGLKGKAAINPEELFDLLSLGRTAGYKGLRRGDFPAKKIGGRYMIPVPALVVWLLDCDIGEQKQATPLARHGARQILSTCAWNNSLGVKAFQSTRPIKDCFLARRDYDCWRISKWCRSGTTRRINFGQQHSG